MHMLSLQLVGGLYASFMERVCISVFSRVLVLPPNSDFYFLSPVWLLLSTLITILFLLRFGGKNVVRVKIYVKVEPIPCITFLLLTKALKSFISWFFSSVFIVLYISIVCILPKYYCSFVSKSVRYKLLYFFQCQRCLAIVFETKDFIWL